MSIKRKALAGALKTACREEVRAATLFDSLARNIKDAQLHGRFMQYSAQEQGGVATVEGLLDSRGVGRPALLGLTRIGAFMTGGTARVRPWRVLIAKALGHTERRARVLAEAASGARIAGDIDAARSLDGLRENAGAQAAWFRDFLK